MDSDPTQLESTPSEAIRPDSTLGSVAWFAGVFCIGLTLRMRRAQQSLWGDEMDSLFRFVTGPWRVTVAARAGEYIPNNHIFYNLLARLALAAGTGGQVHHPDAVAMWVRMPSVLAGSLVPIAIGWPMRRRTPVVAVWLAMVTAVHPWLVAQAAVARGYALMTLLGVIATWRLPGPDRRWPTGYAAAVALAIYTVPVALLLLVGHGLTALLRRGTRASWLRGAAMAGALTCILLAPMRAGLTNYFLHPMPEPSNVADFANQLPRFALAGRYLPASYDPAKHTPDPWIGLEFAIAPVVLVGVGLGLARRRAAMWQIAQPLLATTLAAVALALVMPAAGQVRFIPWAALLVCLAIAGLLCWMQSQWGRIAGYLCGCAAIGLLVWADLAMPPEQPLREALVMVDQIAPAGTPVVLPFFTADVPSATLYAPAAPHHPVLAAGPPAAFLAIETQSRQSTGHRPWLVVSFEFLTHDLAPDAWRYLNANYYLVTRLAGRTSPVAIYAPNDWRAVSSPPLDTPGG